MRAAYYSEFKGPISIEQVDDPSPSDDGVVIRVAAAGLCRSDWHGWQGHDADIKLPHVPGHELAGVIESIGANVKHFEIGERVTLPFCCGCGDCPQCDAGNEQVCDNYFQPGFTGWGAFAERVAIPYADNNLVRLPESIDDVTATSLGCRFITAFRAVRDQGRVKEGEWVAVHGCGGVGLSAIMVAKAFSANVVAVDVNEDALMRAKQLGAHTLVSAKTSRDIVEEIREHTHGGVHLSIDAIGHPDACHNSINSLRKRGRHVQVGIFSDDSNVKVSMADVMSRELEIIGSHGMQAHRYPEVFDMIETGALKPEKLLGKTIGLDELPAALTGMAETIESGITVVRLD